MRQSVDPGALKPGLSLRFLYHTLPGRLVLKAVTRPAVSKLVGRVLSSSFSKRAIPGFIRKNNIDPARYDLSDINSYNDFFSRPIRPEQVHMGPGLVAPCDAKLTVYPIDPGGVFTVKGSPYALAELLGDAALAGEFAGGTCLIFRLTVDNYHRYHYFDDCVEVRHWAIPGVLHTVQPIAFARYNVYHRNSREVTVLDTAHFGRAVQVEVGALCVGKIENRHPSGPCKRGEEKGRFLFGGSTVVVLLRDVQIDSEVVCNTQKGLETVVCLGEQIGSPSGAPTP